MPDRPPRAARSAALALRATALVLAVLIGMGAYAGGDPAEQTQRLPAAVQRAVDRHHCSTTGFEKAIPVSALVRTGAGRLRLVSFDDGWRLYTRHGHTTLVAVCLDPPARG